jgi:TRAP-type mannitol/chloroaromatic compound transport system permease large subunit
VPKLYAGAFLPGLLLASLYIFYVIVRCAMQPQLAPRLPVEQRNVPTLKVAIMLLQSFVPLCLLILSVLGAIFFGLATPTEAAAMGSMGSLILAVAYRSMTFEKLKESVFLTARTSAMVCWLFVGSFIFSSIFAYLGGHEPIKNFVDWINPSPLTFLILTQIIMAPFYLKGVAPKHVTINQIFSGVFPFLLLVLVAMLVLYIFPGLALWLPKQLYG